MSRAILHSDSCQLMEDRGSFRAFTELSRAGEGAQPSDDRLGPADCDHQQAGCPRETASSCSSLTCLLFCPLPPLLPTPCHLPRGSMRCAFGACQADGFAVSCAVVGADRSVLCGRNTRRSTMPTPPEGCLRVGSGRRAMCRTARTAHFTAMLTEVRTEVRSVRLCGK